MGDVKDSEKVPDHILVWFCSFAYAEGKMFVKNCFNI